MSPSNNSCNDGISLPNKSKDPDSDQLKTEKQEMDIGCRRLKRSEPVERVELLGKLEMHPCSELEVMFRGERKREIDDFAEEEDERSGRPTKALCCDSNISEEVVTVSTDTGSVVSSGAVDGVHGEVEETCERKEERTCVGAEDTEEIHHVVPVTCLPMSFSGEVELMSFNAVKQEENDRQSDHAIEAGLADQSGDIHELEENAEPVEEGDVQEPGTGTPSQQGVSLALLNRFPSIDGEEEEDSEQVEVEGDVERVGGGVEEEADEVGERWSRAEASSEPDQVWYRYIIGLAQTIAVCKFTLCSERTSDTLVAWAPPPRQLYCKRPEEHED